MRGRMLASARTGKATMNAMAASAARRWMVVMRPALADRASGVNAFRPRHPFLSRITRPKPMHAPILAPIIAAVALATTVSVASPMATTAHAGVDAADVRE